MTRAPSWMTEMFKAAFRKQVISEWQAHEDADEKERNRIQALTDGLTYTDFYKDPGEGATPDQKTFMLKSIEMAFDRYKRGFYVH